MSDTYCPDHYEGHDFEPSEPPEWMDTSDWDDQAWASWYDDQVDWHCIYCGEQEG